MTDRTPPHDLDAERAALGGMLLNRDALIDVAGILTPGDFYDPRHGIIFAAITAMDAIGEPVDMATVSARLADTGELRKLPHPAYLHDLVEACPVALNAPWFAKRVKGDALRREVIAACAWGLHASYERDIEDTDALAEEIQSRIHKATTGTADDDAKSWAEVADRTIELIESAADSGTQGLSTGLMDLDALIGGLGPGQFIIVAGRPAMGKSVLCADFCRHNAFRAGKHVALFTLEMSEEELGRRIISAETGIGLETLKSGELVEDEWSKLVNFRATTDQSKLTIVRAAGMTVEAIRAKARRMQQREGLDLIVVDYIQLMVGAIKAENRQAEVSSISRQLKVLSQELQVPVVAAAQLNRGVESRADKIPTMADLRESGSLEQDADVVILLHRPAYYDKKTPRGAEVDLIVDKNRHGQQDTVVAVAQLYRSRIVDCAAPPFSSASLSQKGQ